MSQYALIQLQTSPFPLSAFYTTTAMTNHSCSPNIAPVYVGDIAYSFSIRTIHKHTQLFNNYAPFYTLQNRDDRRSYLMTHYGFKCFCEACRNNYPQVEELQHKRYLKCPNCFVAKGCQDKCTSCDSPIDIHKALTGITEGLQMKPKIEFYFALKDYYAALKQSRLVCEKMESVLGIPDYEVATCYFHFSRTFELFMKN